MSAGCAHDPQCSIAARNKSLADELALTRTALAMVEANRAQLADAYAKLWVRRDKGQTVTGGVVGA